VGGGGYDRSKCGWKKKQMVITDKTSDHPKPVRAIRLGRGGGKLIGQQPEPHRLRRSFFLWKKARKEGKGQAGSKSAP